MAAKIGEKSSKNKSDNSVMSIFNKAIKPKSEWQDKVMIIDRVILYRPAH